MRVQDHKVVNWGETYMAAFWRENQLVPTKRKRTKKVSPWFEEPRGKLGSNSRIQFASNESKLVSTNLDPGPHVKQAKKSKASIMAADACGNGHCFLFTTPCIWLQFLQLLRSLNHCQNGVFLTELELEQVGVYLGGSCTNTIFRNAENFKILYIRNKFLILRNLLKCSRISYFRNGIFKIS
jgi:hypothetical protein